MHIIECLNRSIDLDKILPHTESILKGISQWKSNTKDINNYYAVWFSCSDVAIRQHGKSTIRVRDLIDCAFETEEDRDNFFNIIMLKWKHLEEIKE